MAALKDEIDLALAEALALELARAFPGFSDRHFTEGVAAALEPRELLARIDLIADRLTTALPASFPAAAAVLWTALDSPTFTGWMTLPCGAFVARCGLDHPDVALPLLAGLTPRWSSEWAIRPFIEGHPDLTYSYLRRWAEDPDEHVRRLVSEGTRPRLPWAPRLRGLAEDPTPNVELLDLLVDDPSLYVRRSVANHLNDISKDHADLAVDLARRWFPISERAEWTVRHGLRSLVKKGDAGALELLGVPTDAPITLVEFSVTPPRIIIGEAATLTLTVELADDAAPADAVIDYRVHYQGASGPKAPKVFKLTRRRLEPSEPQTLTRTHRFDHVSIRRIHPGPHRIDIQLNGRIAGWQTLEVLDPDTPPGDTKTRRARSTVSPTAGM
jgi:3-methyladenine DNA glycosylase AlkC